MKALLIATILLSFGSQVYADSKKAQGTKKNMTTESSKEKGKKKAATEKKEDVDLFALSLPQGTEIEILEYIPESDTYEVSIKKEPAVGPNVVTPQELHRAIGTRETFEAFASKKNDLVGAEFQLADKMTLLSEEAIKQRTK